MKIKQEKKGNNIPPKFPKLGLKLLAILLIRKEKHIFRLTTCKIVKARKDKIGQQT